MTVSGRGGEEDKPDVTSDAFGVPLSSALQSETATSRRSRDGHNNSKHYEQILKTLSGNDDKRPENIRLPLVCRSGFWRDFDLSS